MQHGKMDRFVDIASVVLISIAAVLTALCGYQSGRWSGEQARLYSAADSDRLQAAEESDRANAVSAVDVSVFIHYVQAVDAGNARFAAFLNRRMRPEFEPALKAWLATKPFQNESAPSSPFVMPEYRLKADGVARKFNLSAHHNFLGAVDATSHADDFLLLTVIFAAVSFLAGISTKMVYPRHAVVVAVASVATMYGIV
ncbi:MAG TPA: hypothetical protein VGF18_03550, partial [Candidatus Tumulicola sp.]